MNMYRPILLLSIFVPLLAHSCNEHVCGSVVTKCLIIQACSCTLKNCTCCQDCFSCLGKVFDECCSCIDLCPSSDADWSNLSKTSYVEEFNVKVPDLFKALTEVPDPADRWTSHTFPVELDVSLFAPKLHIPLQINNNESSGPSRLLDTVNCTVAFMAHCTSMDRCRSSCQSMGASSIRWFHDGCCQCIGDTCINYGLNESKCLKCGFGKDEDEDSLLDLLEDELNFGEEDEDYDYD